MLEGEGKEACLMKGNKIPPPWAWRSLAVEIVAIKFSAAEETVKLGHFLPIFEDKRSKKNPKNFHFSHKLKAFRQLTGTEATAVNYDRTRGIKLHSRIENGPSVPPALQTTCHGTNDRVSGKRKSNCVSQNLCKVLKWLFTFPVIVSLLFYRSPAGHQHQWQWVKWLSKGNNRAAPAARRALNIRRQLR